MSDHYEKYADDKKNDRASHFGSADDGPTSRWQRRIVRNLDDGSDFPWRLGRVDFIFEAVGISKVHDRHRP
jgi:hypothetical protein